MEAGSAGIVTAGIGLVVIGIGLLVASSTGGDLLLSRVFHPRKGKPFDQATARNVRRIGVIALVIGVLTALAPPLVAIATAPSGRADPLPTTTTRTTQPPVSSTSVTTSSAQTTTPTSTSTTTEPNNVLLSQLEPLEGADDFSAQPVRLGGVQYLNPVRLDPAVCGKRQANYDIGGMGYTTFSAAVGLSDTYDDQLDKAWTFSVYAVGGTGATPLFQQIMAFGQVARVDVPVSGVIRLRLQVDWIDRKGLPTCSPLNDFSAVWGDPTLHR